MIPQRLTPTPTLTLTLTLTLALTLTLTPPPQQRAPARHARRNRQVDRAQDPDLASPRRLRAGNNPTLTLTLTLTLP